jgi:aryl-alcohol dehydrogenase-like predicted oxidoreductase
MQYATLGESGLVVSKLCFGAMTLGAGRSVALSRIDAAGADRLVGLALDQGVNFFDTADIYNEGQSERLLGAALGARRREAIISTKVGQRVGPGLMEAGLSARHIHEAIDGSLQRLGTDWVDVYLCHRTDLLTPLAETLAALDQVVRSGKARYLGFSNWPAWLAAKAIEMQRANGWAPFITGQMYYSLLGRDIEAEYAPMAKHCGVGTMVWGPLTSGFLSGKYSRENPTAGGRLAEFNVTPFDAEVGFATLDVLRKIAAARDVPVPAVAIAWVKARPTVSTVIIGFGDERQMTENLASADLVLTVKENAALEAAAAFETPYPARSMLRYASDPAVVAVRQP